MTAISNTLPPPPFPPTASPMSGQEQDQSPNDQQYKVAPPPPMPQGYLPPPPPYSESRHYDNNPIAPRTVSVQPSTYPMAPNNTTVVIRDGGGRGGSHMDGFATGLLMGNMLNAGPSWGWGLGWGWGGHYGHSWGGGVGFYNNDSDIHINNHTQINNYSHYDNHTIDNDYNINNTDVSAAGDCHGSVVGGLGVDVIGDDYNYDGDYDMGGYDGGVGGDAFDAGCDFAF
uniref:Uncharacterized protein n=1 Tax=Strigamia maritima TaxID=126957 RepID=T1JGB8_STRMM